jgi:hypothetical protein
MSNPPSGIDQKKWEACQTEQIKKFKEKSKQPDTKPISGLTARILDRVTGGSFFSDGNNAIGDGKKAYSVSKDAYNVDEHCAKQLKPGPTPGVPKNVVIQVK